jgi:two-component system, cell cycle response regulator DivK
LDASGTGWRRPTLKTVLIVEDNPAGLVMYSDVLERAGYRVLGAEDGAAAIRVATDEAPDLVLMNLSIPMINGVDAIEILKSHPATEAVPVLVVTGHTSPALREEAWQAGCDDYLNKPVPPNRLLAEVEARIGPGDGRPAR